MTTQLKANLRVCASCEWIYERQDSEDGGCPKCGFASYGARYVYGDACYRYKHSQKPWWEKKMMDFACKLDQEIREWDDRKKPKAKIIDGETFLKLVKYSRGE